MKSTPASRLGRSSLAFVVAAALGSTACQDLSTFVTGEKFLRAPEESPRVEVEVEVVVEDSFYDLLEPIGDREELEAAMAQVVLSLADVGMRFYPILSEDYGNDSARPPHLMVVRIQEMGLEIDHETVEQEGHAPRIVMAVEGVACTASAAVQKRRQGAPPLVIGIGNGQGRVRTTQASALIGGQAAYGVKHESPDQQSLLVHRQDLLAAIEKSVVDALREIMPSVDREFAPVEGEGS